MSSRKLSKTEEIAVKKLATKKGIKFEEAKKLFLDGLKKKEDVEETITTASAGVDPGGSGEFKHRSWGDAIARQYKDDEKQREKSLKTGFGAVKYLRQKLK